MAVQGNAPKLLTGWSGRWKREEQVSSLKQIASVAVILVIAVTITLLLINRSYISKIRRLSRTVSDFAWHKNAAVAADIESTGNDELSMLGNQTSAMILELDNYMKNLVAITEELSHTKERVDIESSLARKDALTGVLNQTAYDEEVKRLSDQLRDGESKFGFAVVDLNFLKRINDTYGHERGNTAIKECCDLVRSVFAHSSVFRIGGDEFVVLLEGADYDNAEDLVQSFDREAGKAADKPWEAGAVSAAIGYALYDPQKDSCVENVLSRADKAMYQRKRRMKAVLE